jgi:hypothetical protein
MATATKKEPKAGRTENKSALIREYVKAHRTATAKEISEKVGCSEALVHHVRNRQTGKRKSKPTASAQTIASTSAAVATEAIPAELCVTFVRAAGGFAEAKKMLMTAEVFAGLKIRQ